MPNKVVITGFKDSLINENIIIKPEPIPPINRENPIMKDAETSTYDESSSSSSSNTSRTESGTQSDSPRFIKLFKHISYRFWNSKRFACSIRTSKKQIVNLPMNVKLKKQDIG
nr:hypothetical protein [Mycoplasmopsis bovis]